jgi:hypothetical protein
MSEISCPMKGKALLDSYFLENRARVLEIASFLDRLGRCEDPEGIRGDYRYRSLMKALEIITEPHTKRARAVQMVFSDHSDQPADRAGLPATGAWMGFID